MPCQIKDELTYSRDAQALLGTQTDCSAVVVAQQLLMSAMQVRTNKISEWPMARESFYRSKWELDSVVMLIPKPSCTYVIRLIKVRLILHNGVALKVGDVMVATQPDFRESLKKRKMVKMSKYTLQRCLRDLRPNIRTENE